MAEENTTPVSQDNETPMSGREFLAKITARFADNQDDTASGNSAPTKVQTPINPITASENVQRVTGNPVISPSNPGVKTVSEPTQKIATSEAISPTSVGTEKIAEIPRENAVNREIPLEKQSTPAPKSPFPPVLQKTVSGDTKIAVDSTQIIPPISPYSPEWKNPSTLVEKTGSIATEKSIPTNHIIPSSSTNVLNDQRPLTKFEEGFGKTVTIEDFPWESRKKPVSSKEAKEASVVNPKEDSSPFKALRSDGSHTSIAIRKFWATVNDNLSCLDSALGCVGSIPSDNEWVKERTRALFENVYDTIESLKTNVFKAVEADMKGFVASKHGSDSDSLKTNPEAPTNRWERLESWARWVGRSEDGIVVLKRVPCWTNNDECEICDIEAIRDSGVDIYLLADVLKESDIGKVRKIVRDASKMKGKEFIFRHPKEVRNTTWRPLTSREKATISGSTIGYVTLEWFFETLAYALAKSSKMSE